MQYSWHPNPNLQSYSTNRIQELEYRLEVTNKIHMAEIARHNADFLNQRSIFEKKILEQGQLFVDKIFALETQVSNLTEELKKKDEELQNKDEEFKARVYALIDKLEKEGRFNNPPYRPPVAVVEQPKYSTDEIRSKISALKQEFIEEARIYVMDQLENIFQHNNNHDLQKSYAELAHKNSILQQTNVELRQKLRDLNTEISVLSEMRDINVDLQAKILELKNRPQESKKSSYVLQNENTQLKATIDEIQNKFRCLNAEFSKLKDVKSELQQRYNELYQQNVELLQERNKKKKVTFCDQTNQNKIPLFFPESTNTNSIW